MKSVFNDMEGLDLVIHNLQKVDSKMLSGRFFDARRELLRVVNALEQNRKDLRDFIAVNLEEQDRGKGEGK